MPPNVAAQAQPAGGDPGQVYVFGTHLFRLGDYYRAITELKRFTLLFPRHRQHDAAQVLIGLALQGDAAYGDARAHFQRLSQFNGEISGAQVASSSSASSPSSRASTSSPHAIGNAF